MRGAKILVWVGAGKIGSTAFGPLANRNARGLIFLYTIKKAIDGGVERVRDDRYDTTRKNEVSFPLVTNGGALYQKKTIREKHQSDPIRSP